MLNPDINSDITENACYVVAMLKKIKLGALLGALPQNIEQLRMNWTERGSVN